LGGMSTSLWLGGVLVEALGAAVASVGGRVGERVRLVHSLATGRLLLMNLGLHACCLSAL
jgi:hypothetical protein